MIHLITGGSGSGKSAYAEREIVRWQKAVGNKTLYPFLYVATMKPYGRETQKKIERHRMQRLDAGFLTLERYEDLENLPVPENAGILLECVSNLTANEYYRDASGAFLKVLRGIERLSEQTEHLVVVTNEVHSDINGYSKETEQYRELLGRLNCALAALADRVTEVVYGIPVCVKGNENAAGMEQF